MIVAEPLPYPVQALEPLISARTLDLHYALYQNYVRRVKMYFSKRGGGEPDSLLAALNYATEAGDLALLHNVQQAVNHEVLWRSMTPDGGGEPQGPLRTLILGRWLTYADFYMDFMGLASGLFGSGWVWLAVGPEGPELLPAPNSDQPWQHGTYIPLLCLDMWEHAWYPDYPLQRDRYIRNFLDYLINWEGAEQLLESRL